MAPARKILFYVPSLSGGGAERVFALLASAMAQRGHTVTLAMDYEATDNVGFLTPDVRRVVLGAGHARAVLALAALLRRDRMDTSLSALGVANVKHAAAAALAMRLPRAILTYHGHAQSEPGALSRLGYRLVPLLTRMTARTVVVSDGLRRHLVEEHRAAGPRVMTIHNPVMTGALTTPSAPVLAARFPTVLAAGRLVANKGFVTLLRAFALARPQNARLVILGEGPERDALLGLARALGVSGRVELPGYVAEPWLRYEQARCFVSASRSEAFGNVVVEALAAGLPVVSTACDGPAEILEDGAHGRLVPVDDAAAMAEAITAALADPGDPAARRARADVFSVAAAADRYERLIQEVASR